MSMLGLALDMVMLSLKGCPCLLSVCCVRWGRCEGSGLEGGPVAGRFVVSWFFVNRVAPNDWKVCSMDSTMDTD